MAFVVCALIMYMLWWHKPFGMDRQTVLTASTYDLNYDPSPRELPPLSRGDHTPDLSWQELAEMYFGLGQLTTGTLKKIVYGFGGMVGQIFGRENLASLPEEETRAITFYAAGTLFSAFHIGAWNWEFPSPIIRTLWRTFALAATGTGPAAIFLMSFYVVILYPKFPSDSIWYIIAFLMFLLALIYIISRLALIVLIFYCFSSMPAGVYETVDWTKFLPHFS